MNASKRNMKKKRKTVKERIIDFWKIEVISKNKLKLWVKVVDFNRTIYAEYPFYKVSNDYSY